MKYDNFSIQKTHFVIQLYKCVCEHFCKSTKRKQTQKYEVVQHTPHPVTFRKKWQDPNRSTSNIEVRFQVNVKRSGRYEEVQGETKCRLGVLARVRVQHGHVSVLCLRCQQGNARAHDQLALLFRR